MQKHASFRSHINIKILQIRLFHESLYRNILTQLISNCKRVEHSIYHIILLKFQQSKRPWNFTHISFHRNDFSQVKTKRLCWRHLLKSLKIKQQLFIQNHRVVQSVVKHVLTIIRKVNNHSNLARSSIIHQIVDPLIIVITWCSLHKKLISRIRYLMTPKNSISHIR